MRLYNQPHAFYAGVDLHARSLFTHVLDHTGRTVFEKDPAPAGDDFAGPRPPLRPDDRVAI